MILYDHFHIYIVYVYGLYMYSVYDTTWCTTLRQPWHKPHSAFLNMFVALWRPILFLISSLSKCGF